MEAFLGCLCSTGSCTHFYLFIYTNVMDWHKQNVKVYDESAQELASYFSGIGPRFEDIERGLELAGKKDGARVIELGCGDGRDAAEIIKRVNWYEGIDPSRGLLDIAKRNVPSASFKLTDALAYKYPENLDVIFAFASLLHINQSDLRNVFYKANLALRVGGIFYISLKYRSSYAEETKEDKYGERMFYYYNSDIIEHIAGESFETIYKDRQSQGSTDWFTIALQKVSVM